MTLTIDPEFQALCPPLLPEEREQLEASLVAEGCRDPLMIWLPEERAWCARCEAEQPIGYFFERRPYSDDHQWMWLCLTCHDPIDEEEELEPLVLDGHNRYAICTQRTLEFDVRYQRQLATREEAINWIIANQLGRRNLTPEQKSYLRGKRYNLEKGAGHGKPGNHSDTQKASERLAEEYKVGAATIQRDGAFATAVDTLEAQVRQDIRDTVLRRQDRDTGKITKQQVAKTGKLVQEQTVTPQPFMRRDGWKPYQVLEAIEILATIPSEAHEAINRLLDQPFTPAIDGLGILKNLQNMPKSALQLICRLSMSTDPGDRSDATILAAKKAPPPDKQSLLAGHLIHLLKGVREYQKRNWQDQHTDEPWSQDLQAIDTQLAAIQDDWHRIAALVNARRAERVATYASTFTT